MDFVVGIEVHLSNNHNCKGVPAGMFFDICDELQGKYPKDFKFTGWHPHCRCYATSILKTEAEMEADTARIMNGEEPTKESESKNYIGKDYSGNDSGIARFGSWVDQNEKRIEGAKSLPYFMWNNDRYAPTGAIPIIADRKELALYSTQKEYKNGGSVKIMNGYDTSMNDFKALRTIANNFARNGQKVLMPSPIHRKSQTYKDVYGSLIGTKYEGKCPDLIIDGVFYEYESFVRPWKKKKVGRMISHGLAQSDRIIIDNNKGGSDRLIRKAIMARQNLPKQNIEEVWIYESGSTRLFYKRGLFYKKQQES